MAEKTYEFSEFLQKRLAVDWSGWNLRYEGTATYHYSCHNRGIGMAPEDFIALVKQFRGLDFRPLEKMDQCCGFGGTFAVKHADISGAMVRDKLRCIEATGADLVICNDGGCTMNIEGAARRAGLKVTFRHIAQLLDEAMANGAREGVRS
jgi:L-lactate dehydrogenase complex protein LldE